LTYAEQNGNLWPLISVALHISNGLTKIAIYLPSSITVLREVTECQGWNLIRFVSPHREREIERGPASTVRKRAMKMEMQI
jgi:hypothetical protein